MWDSYKLGEWLSFSLIRAHLCTLAVAVSFNSTWRVPRDAFRYGGLSYGLTYTVAMVVVALPITLLQLAVGQLSQQDTIGMWRAVPFFRGVGYLRLLINFLGSIYTILYLSLTIAHFLYTSSNSIPFWECVDLLLTPEGDEKYVFNASLCLQEMFMAPVADQPEYYIAMALVTVALWLMFPFVLYNPIKCMKRIFYALAPLVIILAIVILSCIGDKSDVVTIQNSSDWRNFLEPNIWHGALTQAMWSSQIAGGYLVSSGDTIYSNTNVKWTALVFIGANIVLSWAGLIFWFGIGGSTNKDISAVAVVLQTLNAFQEKDLSTVWPLLVFVTLFISGIITMISLLYPLYDRFRRIGGHKWRYISVVTSLVGTAATLAVLAGKLPALNLLEDIVVPFLISLTTVLEISAFIFIYGWKVLVEDVAFLTGRDLEKYWVLGWCAAPGIIVPLTTWWLIVVTINDADWTEPPWNTIPLIATAGVALVIFFTFALVSVARQVQYDIFGKLKSSFMPSRHWGPRDPITHYYWLARRDEVNRGNVASSRYHRRQLGQLSGRPSFLNVLEPKVTSQFSADVKRRANSDDWLYTVYRRQNIQKAYSTSLDESQRYRSKSLDWSIVPVNNFRSIEQADPTGDPVVSTDSIKKINNVLE